jgi:hypothetical protein
LSVEDGCQLGDAVVNVFGLRLGQRREIGNLDAAQCDFAAAVAIVAPPDTG